MEKLQQEICWHKRDLRTESLLNVIFCIFTTSSRLWNPMLQFANILNLLINVLFQIKSQSMGEARLCSNPATVVRLIQRKSNSPARQRMETSAQMCVMKRLGRGTRPPAISAGEGRMTDQEGKRAAEVLCDRRNMRLPVNQPAEKAANSQTCSKPPLKQPENLGTCCHLLFWFLSWTCAWAVLYEPIS